MCSWVDVYLGLGSNIDGEKNLRAGVAALKDEFGDVRLSKVYHNPAVGFDGDPFLNMALQLRTAVQVRPLLHSLHRIEEKCGRDRQRPINSSRSLDIDLLLYGDVVCEQPGLRLPRPDIQTRAFVLCPLAEVAADVPHPVVKSTISQLWHDFTGVRELRVVALDFT